MPCNITNRSELIEKYILKELTPDQMRSFEEHFLDCDKCFSELSETSQLKEFIKEEGNLLFEEYIFGHERDSPFETLIKFLKKLFIPKFTLRPVLAYGFTAFFSGLIIFNMFYSVNDNFDTPSERLTELKQLYPDNFTLAPELESQISQVYRSSITVDVVSPKIAEEFENEITFSWKLNEKQPLTLKILDNKENIVKNEASVTSPVDLALSTEKFNPGLYYWKLETENDLLYVGKFFVK